MTYPYTHTGYVYSYKDCPRTQEQSLKKIITSFSHKPEFVCYCFTHTYYGTHVTTSITMVSE